MGKIRYVVSMDDAVALNQHFCRHSSTMRWLKAACFVGAPTLLMAIAVCEGFREQSLGPPLGMLLVLVPYVLIMILSVGPLMKLMTKWLYRERPDKVVFGEHELKTDEQGFTERSDVAEHSIRWEGVNAIQTTPRHAFIFVGAWRAFIVPRASVLEGDFDEFISEARDLWRAKCPQQPVQRNS